MTAKKTVTTNDKQADTFASKALPDLPAKVVEREGGGFAIEIDTGACFTRQDGCDTIKDVKAYWEEVTAFEVSRRGGTVAAMAKFRAVKAPAKEASDA